VQPNSVQIELLNFKTHSQFSSELHTILAWTAYLWTYSTMSVRSDCNNSIGRELETRLWMHSCIHRHTTRHAHTQLH